MIDSLMNNRKPVPARPLRNAEIIASDWGLDTLVAALRESREVTHSVRHKGRIRELPSREVLAQIVEALASALFPTHYGQRDPDRRERRLLRRQHTQQRIDRSR